jgi:hypothetical protein
VDGRDHGMGAAEGRSVGGRTEIIDRDGEGGVKRDPINHLSKLWARITGTSHLPARGLRCERCQETGHVWCRPVHGPDSEHLFIELANIERRAA